jgi:hypothetical protein
MTLDAVVPSGCLQRRLLAVLAGQLTQCLCFFAFLEDAGRAAGSPGVHPGPNAWLHRARAALALHKHSPNPNITAKPQSAAVPLNSPRHPALHVHGQQYGQRHSEECAVPWLMRATTAHQHDASGLQAAAGQAVAVVVPPCPPSLLQPVTPVPFR